MKNCQALFSGPIKLKTSLNRGFGFILNEYARHFNVGQKNQKWKAEKYVPGLFCAERGKRNNERMVEEVN
jgi:hypothetical protein